MDMGGQGWLMEHSSAAHAMLLASTCTASCIS
jgi:hypothetical protein